MSNPDHPSWGNRVIRLPLELSSADRKAMSDALRDGHALVIQLTVCARGESEETSSENGIALRVMGDPQSDQEAVFALTSARVAVLHQLILEGSNPNVTAADLRRALYGDESEYSEQARAKVNKRLNQHHTNFIINILEDLSRSGYVKKIKDGRFNYWQITKEGIALYKGAPQGRAQKLLDDFRSKVAGKKKPSEFGE